MIAVADTTPLNYLVLIDQIGLLPHLFKKVVIPTAVFAELRRQETPQCVRAWIDESPSWLRVHRLRCGPLASLEHLDPGEQEAIALAEELQADQLIVDESAARKEAARRNLPFIGTLGILRRAARLGLVDLSSALGRLQQTSFHVHPEFIESLLEEASRRKNG